MALFRQHPGRREGDFHQGAVVGLAGDAEAGVVGFGQRLGDRQAQAGAARTPARRGRESGGTVRARSAIRSRSCRRRCRAPASTASLSSLNAVETMTWPPAPVNLIEFDNRLSAIWRTERASATIGGRFGGSEVRMMTRSRLASCCMMATHCCTMSLRLTLTKRQVELAGLDLGQIEQIVEQRNQMAAGGVNVLEVLLVAVVADGAEALVHHHFGKADDGVERRADLVADLGEEFGFGGRGALGLLARIDQFFLGALPGGDVAQHRAEFIAVLDPPHGDVERHQPALAHAADRFAPGIEQAVAAAARQPVEIVERDAPAFRREQFAEAQFGEIGGVVAEQRLARCDWPTARGRRGRAPARRRWRCREWRAVRGFPRGAAQRVFRSP